MTSAIIDSLKADIEVDSDELKKCSIKDVLKWCLEWEPKTRVIMLTLGQIYYFEKSKDAAIYWFNKCCAGDSDYPIWLWIGACHKNLPASCIVAEAIHCFEKASKQEGKIGSEASVYLGNIYKTEKKDIEQALHWYTRSAELSNPRGMNAIGLIYTDKCHQTAWQWYQKAIKIDPTLAVTYWNLGLLALKYTPETKTPNKWIAAEFFSLSYKYYKELNSPNDMEACINSLKYIFPDMEIEPIIETLTTIKELREENERLKTELMFRPDGIGAKEAAKHFYSSIGA